MEMEKFLGEKATLATLSVCLYVCLSAKCLSNCQTSSAGSATLGDTSWATLTTELIRCLGISGGYPHSNLGYLADVQTRVGTPHKILRF